MRVTRRTLLVVLAAVLGIVLAAAVTWGTSQLVRQHIGLASEPLTAGHRLLPSATSTAGRSTATPPATVTTTPTISATSSTSTAPPASGPPQLTTAAPAGDGGDSGRGDD